ncbi:MAG: hypothetical protein RLP09_09595 [Sandaracinaceae bacterium]
MAALVRTLAQLTTRIRNRCDQANSTFVTDPEIAEMVNQSAAALWEAALDGANPTEFAVGSVSASTVAGTQEYTLAATGGPSSENDLYRVIGVDVLFLGRWRPLKKLANAERNAFEGVTGWTGPGDTFYRLQGRTFAGEAKVSFYPTPSGVHSFRVAYTPLATEVDGTNALVALNGWDEYVISDVCAMIAEKEESDAAGFLKRRDAALVRVLWAAANLDDEGIERIRETVNWGEPDPHEHEPLV